MKNALHDAAQGWGGNGATRRSLAINTGVRRLWASNPRIDVDPLPRRRGVEAADDCPGSQQIAAELFPPQSVGNSGEVPPRYNL